MPKLADRNFDLECTPTGLQLSGIDGEVEFALEASVRCPRGESEDDVGGRVGGEV